MSSHDEWDRKTRDLVKEAELEEEEEKKRSDAALGLQEGPQGPPTAKAKEERESMSKLSAGRQEFISGRESLETKLEHHDEAEPIVVPETLADHALVLFGSTNVTYQLPAALTVLKIFVMRCENVRLHVDGQVRTSFLEVSYSREVQITLRHAIGSVQCDECGAVLIHYMEPENAGMVVHQNSPELRVQVGGGEAVRIGCAGGGQLFSAPAPGFKGWSTEPVRRGEGEVPLNIGDSRAGALPVPGEPDEEAPPQGERARARAEVKREEGNAAFIASDFLQAAVYYTEAIELCGDLHLAHANRAQCFLKAGQPDKALVDAQRCTELDPTFVKGWFRKGLALHALGKYPAAIAALLEAERLGPDNAQISDAIKMAQLMARTHPSSECD